MQSSRFYHVSSLLTRKMLHQKTEVAHCKYCFVLYETTTEFQDCAINELSEKKRR